MPKAAAVHACLAVLLFLADPLRATVTAGFREPPEARCLQDALRTSANPDSIKFLMARAYRGTDDVEGRNRALSILAELRPRHFGEVEYHTELAATYLAADRQHDARRELERVVRIDPLNVGLRVAIARSLIPIAVRYVAEDELVSAGAILDSALTISPGHAEALHLRSVVCCIRRLFVPDPWSISCLEGCALSEAAIARDSSFAAAYLVRAVHALDLGNSEESDDYFRRGLLLSDDLVRIDYYTPRFAAGEEFLAELDGLAPPQRLSAITQWWNEHDLDPVTPVCEQMLEYWKRMTLAELLYGDPSQGLKGWNTPRGEILVRYGAPQRIVYRQAFIAKKRNSIVVIPPKQHWVYALGSQPVVMTFEDNSLRNRFFPEQPSVVEKMVASLPSLPHAIRPGGVQVCYIAAGGRRQSPGETRETVSVGFPPWDKSDSWWKDALVQLVVLGSDLREIRRTAHQLHEDSLRVLKEGARMAVLSTPFDLLPGSYSLVVELDAPRFSGSFHRSMVVRNFGTDSLQLSDLVLRMPSAPPTGGGTPPAIQRRASPLNPGGLVWAEALGATCEVYNLRPGPDGLARYQVRYAVLARAAVKELQYRGGEEGWRPPSLFGEIARDLSRAGLDTAQYRELLFPATSVRVAAGGRGTIDFMADATGLSPGEYGLVVTVTDLVAGRAVTQQAPFRVISDPEFRVLFR